nr:hypothetical protein [Bacteroidota bacterium]
MKKLRQFALPIMLFLLTISLSLFFGHDPLGVSLAKQMLTPTAIIFAAMNGIFIITFSALNYNLKSK